MAKLTVVALGSLGAIARHVAETTASVAGLTTARSTTAVSTAKATAIASALFVSTALTAVAGNVANLAALVAFLTTAHATSATGIGRWCFLAIARQVTDLAAAEARLLLSRCGALAAQVALAAAVVACWVTLGWAVAREVVGVTACDA